MEKKKINNFGYLFLRPLFYILMRTWYNPKLYDKENIPKKGPTILACNHTFDLDGFALAMGTRRGIHFLAKKELHDGKLGWLFRFIGTIPVDRKNKDENAKDQSLEVLKAGAVYGIFPEGTINRKKENLFLPFRYGAVSFAQKTNAWIVPSVVYGKYKFRSKDLSLKYGKPFKVENMTLEEANEMLREKMTELYYELEKINKEKENKNVKIRRKSKYS